MNKEMVLAGILLIGVLLFVLVGIIFINRLAFGESYAQEFCENDKFIFSNTFVFNCMDSGYPAREDYYSLGWFPPFTIDSYEWRFTR